jgi:hypothetical protein
MMINAIFEFILIRALNSFNLLRKTEIVSGMALKSALPPLPHTRTERELRAGGVFFTDIAHKNMLIDKARLSSTTLDLNDIISELQVIFRADMEAMNRLTITNKIKVGELARERKHFEDHKARYETMLQNTSIVHHLTQRGANLPDKINELKNSIMEWDVERLSQNSPPMLIDPITVIEKKESDLLKWLHLKELNFREIEAVIYLLKKRNLSVDQSDESLGAIQREFGSVHELITLVRNLERENEELRNNECWYMQDAFTKRRNYYQLTNTGTRCVIPILQAALSDGWKYGRSLGFELETPRSGAFDDIARDTNFLAAGRQFFEENDVDSSATSSMRDLSKCDSPIDSLMTMCNHLEATCSKLVADPGRVLPVDFPEFPSSPVDLMIKANADLFISIRKKSIIVDRAQEESFVLTKNILKALVEKHCYEETCSSLLYDLRELGRLQWMIVFNEHHNRCVVATMNMLICHLGLLLLRKDSDDLTFAIFKANAPEFSARPQEVSSQRSTCSSRRRKGLRATMLGAMAAVMSSRLGLGEFVEKLGNEEIAPQVLEEQNVGNFPAFTVQWEAQVGSKGLNLLAFSKQYALFCGLELAQKLYLGIAGTGTFRPYLCDLLKDRLAELRIIMSQAFQEWSVFTNKGLARINRISAYILVKEYTWKSVQVTLVSRHDEGVQGDEVKKIKAGS